MIEQVESNNLDMKQPIKPQIRAVLLIKEPLILEHFVIDTISHVTDTFSLREEMDLVAPRLHVKMVEHVLTSVGIPGCSRVNVDRIIKECIAKSTAEVGNS